MGKALIGLIAVLTTSALLAGNVGSGRSDTELAFDDEVVLETKGYLIPVSQVQVSPRVSE
jgi:hypothetical protein